MQERNSENKREVKGERKQSEKVNECECVWEKERKRKNVQKRK